MGQTGWILVAVGIVAIVVLMQRGSGQGTIIVQPNQEPQGNPAKQPFGNPPASQNSWIEDARAGIGLASDAWGFMRQTGIFESDSAPSKVK
jgi:hypothetical protein